MTGGVVTAGVVVLPVTADVVGTGGWDGSPWYRNRLTVSRNTVTGNDSNVGLT